MKNVKHTKIGYHDATILAGRIISEFYGDSASDYDYMNDFIEDNFNEIIVKFVKPHKFTVLHMLIKYYDDLFFSDGIREILKNVDWDDYEIFLEYMSTMISNAGVDIGIRFPDFGIIDEAKELDECDEFHYVDYYISTLEVKRIEAQPILVHSTFHILMMNKMFLRDLNNYFSTYLQKNIDKVPLEYLDKYRRLSRPSYWNSWLKRGIFFRDKGVCTLCRKDLTGSYNLGINFEIDHIVPLSKYGNNDPSNLQILCNECNLLKSNRSSETSQYDIPLWNLTND